MSTALPAVTPPLPVVEATLRILLVENEETHGLLAAAFLAQPEATQFTVDWVSTCAEALRRAVAVEYDALVVDATLRDGDGVVLVEQLRAAGVAAPALVTTASGDEDVVSRAICSGADDCLVKAYGLAGDTLGRAVIAMVERRALTAAAEEAQAQASALRSALRAARSVEQDLSATLAAVVDTGEMLAAAPDLPGELRPLARAAVEDARAAAHSASRLKRLTRRRWRVIGGPFARLSGSSRRSVLLWSHRLRPKRERPQPAMGRLGMTARVAGRAVARLGRLLGVLSRHEAGRLQMIWR